MIRVLIGAALLLTGFVAALGIASGGPPVKGNFTLEKVQSFQRYQLYYAGRRVAGLPLTSVDRFYYPTGKWGPEVDFFSFTYGTAPLRRQRSPTANRPPAPSHSRSK